MVRATAKNRRQLAAPAAFACALMASWVMAVGPASAEEGDSAPLRPVSEGGLSLGDIHSPSDPEEYPLQFELGEGQSMSQIDEHEVAVEYSGHVVAFTIKAPLEHDSVGANVPTTLEVTGKDVVTFFVHHRAGNPAARGAPFAYPITGGAGWEGGYHVSSFEMNDAPPPKVEPAAVEPVCVAPSLRNLSLRAAKARLARRTARSATSTARPA